MTIKPITISGYIFCFAAFLATLWMTSVNFIEIVARANGEYTFYSQRATLSDDEAILYFSGWTILFIALCYLSVKSLIKEKYIRALIYAVVVLLSILLSTYIDTLFYHQLV